MLTNALAADFTVRQLRDLAALFELASEPNGPSLASHVLTDAVAYIEGELRADRTLISEGRECSECARAQADPAAVADPARATRETVES